jgi:hypothetical protein
VTADGKVNIRLGSCVRPKKPILAEGDSSMIQKPLDRIEKEDIDSLVANEVREDRTLEYKQALPTNSDDEKREFLADISSFANASGGDILYGVEEKRDASGKTTGIPENATGIAGLNADYEIRRLPDLLIEDLSVGIESLLQPAFDAMWQASGWQRCFNYDEKGNRVNSDKFFDLPL